VGTETVVLDHRPDLLVQRACAGMTPGRQAARPDSLNGMIF
jgi:hypothetical protein